ncbi:MAG: radical SAM protein [Elusimicrobia bacterium]|nr:radical SAM protein [Elusimicrobiota bacterium]
MNENIKKNELINSCEIDRRKTVIDSTPLYVTLGTHFNCNAQCIFCLGGDYPSFTLETFKTLFEPKLGKIMRAAVHLGFCGFGETLLMPDIVEFLEYLNLTLPDVNKAFTTNGIALSKNVSELMLNGKYSLMVSLHASNAELHRIMTGTNAFDKIISNIRFLVAQKKARKSPLHINLVFLATTQNIDDLPAFVQFAADLGVDRVTCNHINLYQPEQFRLSCFFIQDKANEVFNRAEIIAQHCGVTLILPPRFGKYPAPLPGAIRCHDPWNFFYVETQGSVNPCCYAGNHIGYITENDFNDIWNGPDYIRMREGHISGNIHSWCKYCFRYDVNNINDIRSHVTFRPETQKMMLQYLKEHADEYPVSPETLEL